MAVRMSIAINQLHLKIDGDVVGLTVGIMRSGVLTCQRINPFQAIKFTALSILPVRDLQLYMLSDPGQHRLHINLTSGPNSQTRP